MKLSGVFLLLGFLATPILGLPDIAAALKKPEDLAPLFRALDPAHSGEGVSDTDADHRQLQRQFFTRLTNINQAGDSFVRELTVFDDKLYFVASNGEDDNLYEFDGNEARLVLATDRMGYGGPSVPEPIFNPSNLTVCNGYLYYVTPSGSDVDLYEFDGSEYEYLSEPDLRNTLYCWRDTLYWAEFDEPVARRQLAEAGEFIRSYNRDRQYGFEFESYRQNYHSSIGNMYGFDDKLYYWADGSIWSTDLQLSAQQLMDSGFPQFADLNGKLIYTDFAVVLEYDPEIDVVQEEDGNPSLLAETELPFAPVVYNGNVYYTGVILSEGDPRGGVFKYNGRSEPQLISENSLGLLFTVFRGLLYFFEAQLEGEPAFFLSIYDGSRFSRTRIEDESALVIFGALFGGGPGVPGGPGEEEFFRNFRFVESRGTLYLTGFDESGGVELFRLNPTSFPEESESPDSEECFSSQDTVEVLDRGTVQIDRKSVV